MIEAGRRIEMTPVLMLEMNEIPWRVIDRFSNSQRWPNLSHFFDTAHLYTSVAVDTGELSPWVTWPTLHRGMNNDGHNIRNLGQDPDTFAGKTIWDELRAAGHSIGVFGSMQSWPPREPGPGGFYVPDTFAHDSACFPESLSPMLAFNLNMVRRNGRVVDTSLPKLGDGLAAARTLLTHGLRPFTAARLAGQLAAERVRPRLASRRPIFQTILFWDLFRHLFQVRRPPSFTTFFTNHVAGVMHRYWSDVFPEDFPDDPSAGNSVGAELMIFAMDVTDQMVGDALRWSRQNPRIAVVFATSMGQAAVRRTAHEGIEMVVENLPLLMAAAGVAPGQFNPLLAMAPQAAVEIADDKLRAVTAHALRKARCGCAEGFISVQEVGRSLSITVSTPRRADADAGFVQINGREISIRVAGLRIQPVEPGTAYHVPEGVFAILAPGGGAPDRRRAPLNADQIKPLLLNLVTQGPSVLERMRSSEMKGSP
jgi:hypothetical protein